MAETRRKIGPHSRLLRRGSIDGRSREGRFLRAVRAELVEQIGDPSSSERGIIETISMLRLHLALFDEKVASGKALSDRDHRYYLAYSNTATRLLARLRKGNAAPPGPTLQEYLAAKHGEVAAA